MIRNRYLKLSLEEKRQLVDGHSSAEVVMTDKMISRRVSAVSKRMKELVSLSDVNTQLL